MMPIVREKKKIRVQSFNGGEDSTSEPALVKTPFGSLVRNANIKEAGKAEMRLGHTPIGETPDTLIAQWSFFASDADDDIGTNDGTETSITYSDGKFGKAAVFNGTTSSIVVDADTTIDAVDMVDFAITVWVYIESDGENNVGAIFDKVGTTTAGYRAWTHSETADTIKLSFEVQHATTDALVVTSTTVPIDTLTKLEFHSNADDSLDIMIDGVVASYSTDTAGVGAKSDDSANDLYIGNKAAGTAAYEGTLQLLSIYDGTRAADEYEQDSVKGLTHYKVGSTIDRIYRIRDKDLERLDDDYDTWTTIDAGFTADKTTNFVQAKDILFILNGTDNVHSMDSSESITDEGDTNTDPPKTTLGAWAQNNRLFLAGSLTESERDYVWFSDTFDPQTYDRSVNVFKVRSGTAGKVTWLEPFKLNELIVYKEDSVFALNMTGATPLSDWTLQPVNTTIGCKAGRTVQDIGNDQVFLDNNNFVRLLSRTTFDKLQTSVISAPIQSTLDTINTDAINTSCSAFVNGKYYLAIPTGTNTTPNVVLIWDTEASRLTGNPASGWSVIPTGLWYPSDFTSFEFGDNIETLVFSEGRALSLCYKVSGNLDYGKTITMDVAGPTHDMSNRATDKIWGPLHVVWDAGENVTAEMFADINGEGFISLGTISLVGDAPVLPINLPFTLSASDKATQLFTIKQIGRGKTCRIKGRLSTYNNTATFVEYELWGEERIPRA